MARTTINLRNVDVGVEYRDHGAICTTLRRRSTGDYYDPREEM